MLKEQILKNKNLTGNDMLKKIFRSLLLFVATAAVLISSCGTAQAASEQVKVGVYDNPPKIYRDSSGNVKGVFGDVMNAIGRKEDWNITWVYGTWDQCLQRLKDGEIDIMVDVAESAERKAAYDFNDETVILAWGQVFSRKDLSIESMTDLGGKKLAVMESGILYDGVMGIKPLTESFDIKPEFVNVKNYDEVFKMLDQGTADVGVVNNIFGLDQMDKYDIKATNIIFQPAELHFALTKNNPRNTNLIKRIDADLRTMKSDQDSDYYKSLNQNLKGTVQKVAVTPRWVKILMWAAPAALAGILFIVLTSFLVQKRYQRSLKNAIEAKTKELTESEIKYKKLFESSNDALLIVHPERGILDCNKAALKMFKVPSVEEIVALNPSSLSPELQPDGSDSRKLSMEDTEKALTGETRHFEWVHKRSDGSTFDADVTLIKVELGKDNAVLATIRDISEQKKSKERIKELNELKDKFIRVVAHQLRTPMNVVRWNLETILEGEMGDLTELQKEFLQSTQEAEIGVIERMGDLLTVIDIEEDRVTITKNPVSLLSLCESVEETWAKRFQAKGIQLKFDKPTEPLPTTFIDAGKIRNVFDYMLSNSFDYTPDNGNVATKLFRSGDRIRFEIIDTGIGVPVAEQPRIFTKFFRATNASSMVTDRSGICLAICKYYIEQHGGSIGFESKEGAGSTFWFELPIISGLIKKRLNQLTMLRLLLKPWPRRQPRPSYRLGRRKGLKLTKGAKMNDVKQIRIFSTTWCPYCKQEESWLRDQKIDFQTVMVDHDQNAAMYMVEKTGQRGVPVTEIKFEDGTTQFVTGFDKEKLSTLLINNR